MSTLNYASTIGIMQRCLATHTWQNQVGAMSLFGGHLKIPDAQAILKITEL